MAQAIAAFFRAAAACASCPWAGGAVTILSPVCAEQVGPGLADPERTARGALPYLHTGDASVEARTSPVWYRRGQSGHVCRTYSLVGKESDIDLSDPCGSAEVRPQRLADHALTHHARVGAAALGLYIA